MKTFKFVPSCCKGDNAAYEGSIVLRLPTFEERFDYMEKCVEAEGEKKSDVSNYIKSTKLMVSLSKSHYESVDIKHKESGEHFKSFDDLQYNPDMHAVMIEVGTMFIQGFKLGNG